jgi:hypothetical protein
MTTLVASLVTALVGTLQAAPAVASQVSRVRLRPLTVATAQAVVVRPAGAQASEAALSSHLPVSWTSQVAVECYARCGANTTPDAAVDALLEAVYARLMADATLGGTVLSMQVDSVAYDFDFDADQTVCATLTLRARHRAGASFV